MSQRLGCLATETFKVLVFLMYKKANKQSVIYAITAFQKTTIFNKTENIYYTSDFRKSLSSHDSDITSTF